MGFKSKNTEGANLREHVSSNMLITFKRMVTDMRKRGFTDEQLQLFAEDPTGDKLGLKKDLYYDYVGHIFEELKRRTTTEERISSLNELADQGLI